MLAAYLIKNGLSYLEAMKSVVSANPEIELPSNQSAFLQVL
jgi:hypothetical protein